MVFILKERGGGRGIGLVEVACKVCAAVDFFRLKWGFVLQDALHGFRVGQGTGTATLEAKLSQQLAGLAHEPLFQVFLDICKAYDSMDRGRCLEVLGGYGMGSNMDRLLKSYSERQRIVP